MEPPSKATASVEKARQAISQGQFEVAAADLDRALGACRQGSPACAWVRVERALLELNPENRWGSEQVAQLQLERLRDEVGDTQPENTAVFVLESVLRLRRRQVELERIFADLRSRIADQSLDAGHVVELELQVESLKRSLQEARDQLLERDKELQKIKAILLGKEPGG